MHPDAADVGDCLRDVIARIALALMQGDVEEAWAVVDSHDATEACCAWDRLRGRHAASDEEDLERDRQVLLAMLREHDAVSDGAEGGAGTGSGELPRFT